MNRKLIYVLLSLFFCCLSVSAQGATKSDLQLQAEGEHAKGHIATARYLYIRSFEDYVSNGQLQQGVWCATKATALYYNENFYKEAFDLLRRVDQTIEAKAQGTDKDALHYMTTKERLQMYMKLRKTASALDQLNIMERQVGAVHNDSLSNDLLYNKAIYYYSFGQNQKGNAVFKEMSDKLTAVGDYDKVDQVYQTLIANGRKSNNASMVAQSYSNYIEWKDSVNALKKAAEIDALNQRIAANEATIADKDSSLSSRQVIIIGLIVLAVALAAALIFGGLVLLRFITTTRKQKKTINELKENNALKAKFISNISAQLDPSLQRLDSKIPEVKALKDFSEHIQTLAQLDTNNDEVELEEVQVQSYCEAMMEEIRGKVKDNVELIVKAPKMSAMINKEYVSHILRHLLNNAAIYTPEGGHITLDFKKRSAHTQQFLVLDTGCGIPEEKREDVFKPFLEIKDLSQGDGLGLPICKQMAQKMNGDLSIDASFTKGTRFVLDLRA
ncbi:MAG: sensor histidine kinase [Prevotella sp.]|nr:sensor histidine kinase [Prevotella sp.]